MRLHTFPLLLIAAMAVCSCRQQEKKDASAEIASSTMQDKDSTFEQNLPRLFTAKLPCADCDGISSRLILKPDHVFFLEENYMGVKGSNALTHLFTDFGKWSLQNSILTLIRTENEPSKFRISSSLQLVMLDKEGKMFSDSIAEAYTFAPQDTLYTPDYTLNVKGVMTLQKTKKRGGDSSYSFSACPTGLQYKVKMDKATEKSMLMAWLLIPETKRAKKKTALMNCDIYFDPYQDTMLHIAKFRNLDIGDHCE